MVHANAAVFNAPRALTRLLRSLGWGPRSLPTRPARVLPPAPRLRQTIRLVRGAPLDPGARSLAQGVPHPDQRKRREMSDHTGPKASDGEITTEAAIYTPLSETRRPSTARPRLASATDVDRELRDIRDADREHFVTFDLDVRHRLIERRVVAIGSLTGVEVHPREVFRGAIVNGAAAVVFAHNHPSGDPTPSRQDIDLTQRLREVGELCGIQVLDHLVVGAQGYISLAERGWI
jgi:RadC-like JAB domain